jgi:hypothetical protein
MDERTSRLIDRYLTGEATEGERREVETRRQEDPDFRRQLEHAEAVSRALWRLEHLNLREKFASWDAELDAGDPESKDRRRFRPWWWLLAAAVLGLVVLLRVSRPAHGPDAPEQSQQQDSIAPMEAPDMAGAPAETDTTETSPANDNSSPLREQRKASKPVPDGKALFAEYFEPYKDMTLEPNVRGIDDPTMADEFEQQYWSARFRSAIDTFRLLPAEIRQDDRFVFRYGIALMATGDIKSARQVLQELAGSGKSHFGQEAYYYLALLEVREGRLQSAARWLDNYLAGPAPRQETKARSLKASLGQ